ncbi:unnamed protein product [Echinostoma caproni]|uniref:CID domain-containing protein n=1 Tax=Echinostoma caproni TaxID=27848 RepID=A0A183AMT8_9TREM|nr:unnamed protein product [Echinostoma caproni]
MIELSNVFQQVEDNSIELWKFNMYALVVEYNKKPVAPVPLSVFQAVVEFCQFLVRLCNRSPGVAHGVKQIANKTTDIQSTITMGCAQLGDDLITESDESAKENQNDEGAQLFQFVGKRNSRQLSNAVDLTHVSTDAPGKSDFMLKMGKLAAIDDDDEDMRIARQFETNCKRNFLRKSKQVKEMTIDAGISSIKSRIEKLQAEVISVADRLEIALREAQTSFDSTTPSTPKKISKVVPISEGVTETGEQQPLPMEPHSHFSHVTHRGPRPRFPPSNPNPTIETVGLPFHTSPLAAHLDPFDQAVNSFNSEMSTWYDHSKSTDRP